MLGALSAACLSILAAAGPEAVKPDLAGPAFRLDPVSDTALLVGTAGFGGILELIITTGELRAQAPGDPNSLLFIDRPTALADTPTSNHALYSNLLVGGTIALAVVDTAAAGVFDRRDELLTYAMLYGESIVFDWAMTDLVKIAVRRPRPLAYQQVRATGMVQPGTDTALSFYSGHTSVTAAVCATAAYLAFSRDEGGLESWLIAGGGLVLTTLVGIERVNAGAHFPTDVIAGALAGASVGVIVPHLHRLRADQGLAGLRVAPFTGDRDTFGLSIFAAF